MITTQNPHPELTAGEVFVTNEIKKPGEHDIDVFDRVEARFAQLGHSVTLTLRCGEVAYTALGEVAEDCVPVFARERELFALGLDLEDPLKD